MAWLPLNVRETITRIVSGATRVPSMGNLTHAGGLAPAHPVPPLDVALPPSLHAAAEGQLLHELQTARLNGHPLWWNRSTDEARRGVEIMRSGQRAEGMPVTTIGGARTFDEAGNQIAGNFNGELTVEWVESARGMTRVLSKPTTAHSRLDTLTGELAHSIGLDHLVPPSVANANGALRVEFRPGRTASALGVHTSTQLEAHMARGYAARLGPGHDAVAGELARFDAQSMRFLDYVLGNRDRNPGNVLLHEDGTASFIDHEFTDWVAGRGDDVLRPAGIGLSRRDGQYEEPVGDAVRDHMRRHFTEHALRQFAGNAGLRRGDARLEGMVVRLHHALSDGSRLQWSDPKPRRVM